MMKQAQDYLDSGQFPEAEAIYRSLIKDDGSNTQAVFMLALTRQAQGDLDEAIKLMNRASSQEPDNANIHYTLGTLHMSRKSVDDARKSYLSALQANPVHLDSHNGLAFAELIAGNFKAAENAANLALNEDHRNVQALVYMGTAKLEQGDSTKAISYLQEALKEAPAHQSAQLQLGRAFLAAGNHAFATQCFQNIVDADENVAVGWEYLGNAQKASGEIENAAKSFQRALSLGRQSPEIIAALEEFQQARSGGQDQVTDTPGDPEVLMTGAEFEIARGNPAAALEILARAGAGGIERVDLLKARALEQMRNHEAALQIIEPLAKSGEAGDETSLSFVRLLSKLGRDAEADEWIDQLLAQEKAPLFARVFRGFQLCRKGELAGIVVLQEIENDPDLSNVDQRRINKTLAESLDRAGRFDEAADYYQKLSGRLAQVLPVAESAARANREFLGSGRSEIAAGVRLDSASLPSDPVFMFAWPGSGWEWLAAGLGSHPDLMLVADKPETQAKRRALICKPEGRSELESFSSDAAGYTAAQYWSDLKSGQLEPARKTTLDAMWLSADMLPTLARIFPSARVIVVNREPKDMVLDWFRSGYADLQDMAAVYREQREVLDQYRDLIAIEFIDVDGDALQAEPVPELMKLTQALGLSWQDSIGEHLKSVAPKAEAKRGNWSDYSAVLAGPLQLFNEG